MASLRYLQRDPEEEIKDATSGTCGVSPTTQPTSPSPTSSPTSFNLSFNQISECVTNGQKDYLSWNSYPGAVKYRFTGRHNGQEIFTSGLYETAKSVIINPTRERTNAFSEGTFSKPRRKTTAASRVPNPDEVMGMKLMTFAIG